MTTITSTTPDDLLYAGGFGVACLLDGITSYLFGKEKQGKLQHLVISSAAATAMLVSTALQSVPLAFVTSTATSIYYAYRTFTGKAWSNITSGLVSFMSFKSTSHFGWRYSYGLAINRGILLYYMPNLSQLSTIFSVSF